MDLICGECGSAVGPTVSSLATHLRQAHVFLLTAGRASSFRCGQNNCMRSFYRFTSLRRHLRLSHSIKDNVSPATDTYFPHNSSNDVLDYCEAEIADYVDESGPSSEIDVSFDFRDEFSKVISKSVAHLRANTNFTATGLSRAVGTSESILTDVFQLLKVEFNSFLRQKNIPDDEFTNDFLSKLVVPSDCFQGMHTIDGQIKLLKKYFKLSNWIDVPLGHRIDKVKNRSTGRFESKQVLETFQYASIIDTLEIVMKFSQLRDFVENETASPHGYITNFRDGNSFKSSRYFQKYSQALRIQLYYDDIVVNNPLGSKVHAHELGCFYFSIQNLPSYINSYQGAIFVLAICNAADITKYGMNRILEPFVEDMKKLESDVGVICMYEQQEYVLRAALTTVCADTLAAHQLMGLAGPSANYFCRNCMIHRDDLLAGRKGPFQLRTRALHATYLEMIEGGNQAMMTGTGVRNETILNQLNFHFTENWSYDFLHDMCEGVGEVTLFYVIQHMLRTDAYELSVKTLNNRIHLFNYGSPEIKNKPSPNFSLPNFQNNVPNLHHKGAQTFLLLRVFPFLVSDKVSDEDEYLQLILLLNRINEILFSFKLKASITPYLSGMINEFDTLFRRLFPSVNAYNKMHHLFHYVECILESGPPRLLSCFRYEMRHLPLKEYGSKCKNFKKITLTLMKMSMVSQCAWWGMEELPIRKITCSNSISTTVDNCASRTFLMNQGLKEDSTVFVSNHLKVWGIEYRADLLVAVDSGIESPTGLPTFGFILEIVVTVDNNVYLYCDDWAVDCIDPMLNAYRLVPDVTQRLVNVENLVDKKPYAAWSSFKNGRSYVCPRQVFL